MKPTAPNATPYAHPIVRDARSIGAPRGDENRALISAEHPDARRDGSFVAPRLNVSPLAAAAAAALTNQKFRLQAGRIEPPARRFYFSWSNAVRKIDRDLGDRLKQAGWTASFVLEFPHVLDSLRDAMKAEPQGAERFRAIGRSIDEAMIDIQITISPTLEKLGIVYDRIKMRRIAELFFSGVGTDNPLTECPDSRRENFVFRRTMRALITQRCGDRGSLIDAFVESQMSFFGRATPAIPHSAADRQAIASEIKKVAAVPDRDAMTIADKMHRSRNLQWLDKVIDLQVRFAADSAIGRYVGIKSEGGTDRLSAAEIEQAVSKAFGPAGGVMGLSDDGGDGVTAKMRPVKSPLFVNAAPRELVLRAVDDLLVKSHLDGGNFLYSGFYEDGCHYRAHLLAGSLRRYGIRSAKIGVAELNSHELSAARPAPLILNWNRHIAPLVFIREAGSTSVYVLDPAFLPGEGPLFKPRDWLSKISRARVEVEISNDNELRVWDQILIIAKMNLPRPVPSDNFVHNLQLARKRLDDLRGEHARAEHSRNGGKS